MGLSLKQIWRLWGLVKEFLKTLKGEPKPEKVAPKPDPSSPDNEPITTNSDSVDKITQRADDLK